MSAVKQRQKMPDPFTARKTGGNTKYVIESYCSSAWLQLGDPHRSLDKALKSVESLHQAGWEQIRIKRITTTYLNIIPAIEP